MSPLTLALWLVAALVALAVVPTAAVLVREALRRTVTRRALEQIDQAHKLLGSADGASAPELARALTQRFGRLTSERVVLALLRSEDATARSLGSRLFAELGLVEVYARRLSEARRWSERTHAAETLGLAGATAAVPALVGALRDRYEDDASVKVAAAGALAKLRDVTAVPLLVSELKNIEERSSRNVAEALVAFGAAAVPALLDLLVDTAHAAGRVWAARILGRIADPRAADALVARLYDRDDLLRMAAAEALGAIRERRALQALVRLTLRDPAPQVRAHAAAAVAIIEGERAMDVLVAALADPDYATRVRALEAFESMRIEDTGPLEAALGDPNAEVRRRAALALERVGHLEKLVGQVTADDGALRSRAYAGILELGRVGLIDSIASYIHHESFEVRGVVARACGELGMVRVAPLVLSAVDDAAWPVRAAVAVALGTLHHEGAMPALVKLLRDAEEPVREAAAESLTQYPPTSLEPHIADLVGAYRTGTITVRTHAVVLLSRLQGAAADEVLVDASADPSDSVRLRAVEALGGRAGDAVVQALVARLSDASLEVRMAAVAGLGAAASTESFEGLLRALAGVPPTVRERIADALSRGSRAQLFARLDELERSASLDVRIGVAWTLGKTGDCGAVPVLCRFLHDPNASLRASAAGALAKIPAEAGLQALLDAAQDPDGRVRAAVVNALGRLGGGQARALDALEGRTRDPDPFVRNRALVSLARAAGAAAEERILPLEQMASPEAWLVALALLGTESALGRVVDALGRAGTLQRIVEFLDREDIAVRAAFFSALHLDDPAASGQPVGDVGVLVAQYEQVLRGSLDVAARRLAVDALARLRAGRSVEIVAGALVSDPSDAVRLRAAEALERHASDAVARAALARAVADPTAEIAIRAVQALAGRREPEVAIALRRRLATGAPAVQDAVEAALADLYRSDPLAFVDWMMGVDVTEPLVRAVRVLGLMASPDTLAILREFSRSQDAQVRAASVGALAALPTREAAEAIDAMVEDPSEDVRLAVLDGMAWTAQALLRTATLRNDPSKRVRQRAAAGLEKIDPTAGAAAIKALEPMVQDAAPEVRAAALASLAGSASAAGLATFVRLWPEVPLETRSELHDEPRARAISDKLAARLSSHVDPELRRAAVIAIGAFRVAGFEAHVLPALRDPSPEVRVCAVQTLAALDSVEVRARLSEMMSDPDAGVRVAARRSMLRTVG